MNKLLKKAQSSKLNVEKKKKDKVISVKHKSAEGVSAFSLYSSVGDLQELLEKINSLSQRKVTASRLIRALIYLGKKTKESELLKALKEV